MAAASGAPPADDPVGGLTSGVDGAVAAAWAADAAAGRAEDLTGLPAAVIAIAEHVPLRDRGDYYGRRLTEAEVSVEYLPVRGAVHGFLSFTGLVQPARDVLDRLADAVGRALYAGPYFLGGCSAPTPRGPQHF
ncbi:alpha/beta hydrolase fold domain-containing protein [Streptomyces misionensis]|uniref:alpha/beta hydrolase fold domain-containing protein n=1 Tax=Streptomyces misionensis TaxID=67331 RepID=UPI001FC9E564|nr:alpha/beta hydrolase fold domain-containing protein [Streptomyces misionensis]